MSLRSILSSNSNRPPTNELGEHGEIKVEFFGIPRQRAGVDRLTLPLAAAEISVGDVLLRLNERLPGFSACLDGDWLRPQYSANVDGQRFVSDPATRLQSGQTLLILSADAGG